MNRLKKNSLSKAQNSGFTLLEIMIVIGLLGLILLIGFPNFQSMRVDQTLRSEAIKIQTDLKYMQQVAFDTQNKCTMTYGGNSYHIKLDSAVNDLKAETLDNNVKFENDDDLEFIFGTNGLTDVETIITLIKNGTKVQIKIQAGGKIDII